MIAALLIAGGALAHAGWNIAVKGAGARGPYFLTAALALSVVLLAPWGAPALLRAIDDTPQWPLWVGVSGALHSAYFLALQRGYREADVGVVYPIARGAGPLLSVLGAILLLGERPAPVALLGALLVVAGAVVIGAAGMRALTEDQVVAAPAVTPPATPPATSDAAARRWRGIGYGVIVGVLIAAYTLWDAAAVTRAQFDPLGYFWASMVVQLALLLTLSARSPRTLWRAAVEHRVAVTVVALLSPLAYLLILYAYSFAPVALVAPAREASVVLIALAGWVIFREPHPAPRILGSVVVLVGIGLLAVS